MARLVDKTFYHDGLKDLKDLDARRAFIGFCHFHGTDCRKLDFTEATFERGHMDQVDFRGAILNGVQGLETVTGLDTCIFDDETQCEGVSLDRLAGAAPLAALTLRQIRYLHHFKLKHKGLYWVWRLLCDCGRSWVRLFLWGLITVALFACLYWAGAKWSWQGSPCVLVSQTEHAARKLGNFRESLIFSALTFIGFNMPNATWTDHWTGAWATLEAWLGLAFMGVFVTVVAVKFSAKV